MSPEKAVGTASCERKGRHGRLVLGYGHVILMMLGCCMFGVVLDSQFQTTCHVWEKRATIALWSGSDDITTRNATATVVASHLATATTSSTATSRSKSWKESQNKVESKSKSKTNPNQKDKKTTVEEDSSSRPWPRIVWLMSFPNSGTSYTLKMIRYLTDRTTATNYGDRHRHAQTGKSVSVDASNNNNHLGPFWTEPEEKYDKKRPSTYILTKTHCGGSCALCGPYRYVETPHSFLEQCESGLRGIVDSKGKRKVQSVRYDARTTVSKAIHLIRHPLDNIVSRFHLEWNEHHKYNSTDDVPWIRKEFPTNFERNPSGFRLFCKAMAKRYEKQYKKSRFINDDLVQLVKDVPCYGDLMRWIQWHNLALWTTRELQLPTRILYYEDYATRFNETVTDLLDFLQLPPKGSLVPFIAGKSYAETYFTEEERQVIKTAIQMLAFRDTWKLIEHYF